MNFFTQLNKKLDEGWKLTDTNCPICKASIIYNPKDKSLFCIKCDKPCKIEADIIDDQPLKTNDTKNEEKKNNQDSDTDSDYDEYEFKWNMNKNAPPSRTDEISKLLSQKLLQGYAMLQECCAAPIMKSKSGEYTCVGCKWVRTKKEFDEIVEAQANGTLQQESKPQQQQQQQPHQQQQQQTVQQQQQQTKPQEVKKQQVTQNESQKVEQKSLTQHVQPIQVIFNFSPNQESQIIIFYKQNSGESQQFYSTLQRILNKTADFYEKQIDLYTQQGQIAIVDSIIKTSLKELIDAQKQLEKQ